jgi:hypothetical protein
VVELPKVSAVTPAATPQFDEAGKPLPPPPPPTVEEQAAQRQAALDQHIHTLASQPGQEWIGQLATLANNKPDSVHLQQVTAAAQHWNYSAEGLTPEGAAVVVIAVTYFTAGAASGAATTMTGAAVGTTTVASAAIAAGLTTLATQAAVTIINNQGDVGKTLEDMGKSENIRAVVTAMVTAGALQGLNQSLGMSKVNAKSTFTEQLQKNVINNTASALVNHAINGGDLQQQLEQSLKSAFIDTGAAQGANWIGDMKQNDTLNAYTHKLAHAIAGCAAGMAKSDDCRSGALGAVIGEISAELYGGNRTNANNLDVPALQTDTVNFARLMAGVAAAITGNDVNLTAAAGGNAAENNYLTHLQSDKKQQELANCKTVSECNAVKEKWEVVDKKQTQEAQILYDNNKRDSDMSTVNDIKNARNELQAACAVFCTTERQASLNELNSYFLPNGEFNFNPYKIGEMRAIPNQRDGTFHLQASENLSSSLLTTGTGVAVYSGVGILIDMGLAAQTTVLVDGLEGISASQWIKSAGIGAGLTAGTNFLFDPNATPASLVISGGTGALFAPIKLGLNAAAGLANPWLPLTIDNIITYGSAKSFAQIVTYPINQEVDPKSESSWWTTPVVNCGPYPRKHC